MKPSLRKLLSWAHRDGIEAHLAFSAPLVERGTWVVPYGPDGVRGVLREGAQVLPVGTDPHDVAMFGVPRPVPMDLVLAWLAGGTLTGLWVDPEGPAPAILDRWSVFRHVGTPGVSAQRPLPVSTAAELHATLGLWGWPPEDRLVALPDGVGTIGHARMREPGFGWEDGVPFILADPGAPTALDAVGWSLVVERSLWEAGRTPGERVVHELLTHLATLRRLLETPGWRDRLNGSVSRLVVDRFANRFSSDAVDARAQALGTRLGRPR